MKCEMLALRQNFSCKTPFPGNNISVLKNSFNWLFRSKSVRIPSACKLSHKNERYKLHYLTYVVRVESTKMDYVCSMHTELQMHRTFCGHVILLKTIQAWIAQTRGRKLISYGHVKDTVKWFKLYTVMAVHVLYYNIIL